MFDYRLSAQFLKKCLVTDEGEIKGTVCPWVLGEGDPPREDYHDTLEAIYIWSRPENIDWCGESIDLALGYIKNRFDWYSKQSEPLKSYDSSFLLLALSKYLETNNDRQLSDIMHYAEDYLVRFFKDSPAHNAREYSNPYWKAVLLKLYLDKTGADSAFLRDWLSQDTTSINPDMEEVHKGRGYMFPHDFFSTGGTKLMALNVIAPDLIESRVEEFIPEGYVKRNYDETSFNASVLFGLCTLDKQDAKVKEIESEIFSRLESRFVEGGTKRGDYTKLRESWSTFFVYFAELLRDKNDLL